MAKKKISRKELLKEPDEFLTLSTRAILYARQHAGKLKLIGLAVVAALAVYVGTNAYFKYVNRKGQEAYNVAYKSLAKALEEGTSKGEHLKKPEQLFEAVRSDYGVSKASRLALAELGYIKYQKGEYEEAISLFLDYLQEVSDDWYYRSLVSLALASCYEAKGEVQKAVEVLEPISAGPDSFLKGQAMLALARLYELMNKDENAVKLYREFMERFPDSDYLPYVKAQLTEHKTKSAG